MRNFIPRPWQGPMIDFALSLDRGNLLARMGLGKSSASLAVVDARMVAGLVDKTVVFAPLRVARSTWIEEAKKWREFAHLRVNFIEWTEAEREFLRSMTQVWKIEATEEKTGAKQPDELRMFRKQAEKLRPRARDSRLAIIDRHDLQTVHYDLAPQFTEILRDAWPFQMAIGDEATRLKSFRLKQGGRRARALSEIAHDQTRYWLNLSGAIVPNGLPNLWGPMWFIDKGFRLGRTYDAFENRWFGYTRAQDARNANRTHISRVAFPHAQAEIVNLIKDVSLSFNPKDWFDVKEPHVERVYVDLPIEARKRYREMERDMLTTIGDHDIEAFAASGKIIKCMQLANGAVYTGSDEEIERDVSHWVNAHDEKLDALESIVEESDGEVLLVAFHFKPDLVRLKKRFPKGRHIHSKKDEDDFKAGKIPLAFVHPQSIGHGIDGFQNVCHVVVFFAHSYDLDPHDQLVERVGPMRQMQAGLDREVLVYLILARGTIDEDIADRIIAKRHTQDITMDMLAYKPENLWD